MNQPKLISIIGARPHYMKVAPVHREAIRCGLKHDIIHTGQHYNEELTSNYEAEFNLPRAVLNLNVGSGPQVLQMAKIMEGLDQAFDQMTPDCVLVYGDTNSTAAAAIVAAKKNIPLAHVEAGLREFRKDVPEEINKLLIDSVADLLFCPTPSAVNQLKREGKKEGVYFSGDVVYDLVTNSRKTRAVDTILSRKLKNKPFYFITVHREKNTDSNERLTQIVSAIKQLDHQVVFSVHPRTKKALETYDLWESLQVDDVYTVDSRPFWETQWLIANATMTLTDSGGISKESFFHRTPCLLLDDQIEWTELVESGWLKICGANQSNILLGVKTFEKSESTSNVFGKGDAANIIIEEIIKYHAARK